jgi:antitoxin MazE
MKAHLVRVGNSQGVRIPKALLAQCGMTGSVSMQVENGALVLRALAPERDGWEERFAAGAAVDDDLKDWEGAALDHASDHDWAWNSPDVGS